MFKKLKKYLESLSLYVICDAKDNSVTFSTGLFKRLRVMKQDQAKIIVFTLAGTHDYAFMLNPPGVTAEQTQLADVKYDYTDRSVGFECLVPTVNRIFFDYGLPADTKWKLNVKEGTTATGYRYYKICRPDGINPRK